MQYETIRIGFAYTDDDGSPLPLPSAESIEADIETRTGKDVLRLSVHVIDASNGLFELWTNDVVAHGRYFLNVFITNGSERSASTKHALVINRSPTTPAAAKDLQVRS